MQPSAPGKTPDQGKPQVVSEETFLKISKEIAIKFIEAGRITPTNFDKIFKEIHTTIRESSRSK
jgi:hypothetical protein